ncbi:MAG TPA: alpha/beta hydrolase [Chitinophagaceae bacterium]|nr:alpha/beta hydrolase [Chitinophagaceae bacterium]
MPSEKVLDFQKRKIFYKTYGEGPAVVLIHGVPVDNDIWRNQVNELKGFKFIVPDLPGSGASEMIEDMSMEGMAEVIKAILDEGKIATASLIGHSIGGYISLAFAEKYPGYLKGFGLFHSTAYPDSEDRKIIRKKAIEVIEKNGAFEFLKTSIPNLFSPENREKTVVIIEELIGKANNFSSPSLVSYYQAMMKRPGRISVLKNLEIPVLFIAGKFDTAIPLIDSLKQSHLPEKAYFHILSGSGHMGMMEEAEKTNAVLNDYLINLS